MLIPKSLAAFPEHYQPVYQGQTKDNPGNRHFLEYLLKMLDVIFKNSLSLFANQWNLNSALFGFKFLIINIILNTEIHGLSDNSNLP